MSEIKKLPNEKWGPFVRRRDAMKKLNLTTVLEYLEHLQSKLEDEAAVKHLPLGGGGYKRSMKKKRRKSRKKKKKRKTKRKRRRKDKTRKRRR